MRRFVRRLFCSSQRRRYCACLTLVAYLATAFGFPMPSDAHSSSAKAACGCDIRDIAANGSCCCSGPKAASHPSCCTVPDTAKRSSSDKLDPQPPGDNYRDVPAAGVRWVIGIAAVSCGGHSTLWVSAGLVLPAPAPVVWQPQLVLSAWLCPAADFCIPTSLIPPDPPPRTALA